MRPRRSQAPLRLLRALTAAAVLSTAPACSGSSHPPLDAGLVDTETQGEEDTGSPSDAEAEPELDASLMRDDASAADAGAGQTMRVGASFAQVSGATWEGTGMWALDIALLEPASDTVVLQLVTGGTAEAGKDYRLGAKLEVPRGAKSARALITVLDDDEREPSETLSVTLQGSEPAATFTLTISDDDDDRWPSDEAVTEVDLAKAFPGANLSGLAYAPAQSAAPAVLWMVRNSPSQLYRLIWNGAVFTSTPDAEWSQGKTLLFPGGVGAPDAEGLTWAAAGSSLIYVSSERDGAGPSAPAILAFDTARPGASLTAVHAFSLSADLRELMLEANAGPEALTWVPDEALTSAGFFDEATGRPYDPALYAQHGGGLFLVGIEQTGGIYAYALDHASGKSTRVARIDSKQPALMALEFDRDTQYLWAWCDDTCGNQATVLRIEDNPASPQKGRFGVRRHLKRPPTLANVNNEGMTIAPATECRAGKKSVYWVEDGSDDHVLRRGAIPCGPFL